MFKNNLICHFTLITKHKFEVSKLCFKSGLIKQGILHDLSKYSPTEFIPGVKYFQGYRSPINKEKEVKGYSEAELHHFGRNKHHWEYWIIKNYKERKFDVLEMPFNYVLESACDRIAACKIYHKEKYQIADAYEFLINGKDRFFMHPNNIKQLEILLLYLKENGEDKTVIYFKDLYKKWKKNKVSPI